MSYLVLARKWRPKGFEDLVGQDPIARILKNSIEQNKLAHAYVFSGPRGVGKTSTARILAKALNCVNGPTTNPCGECPSCESITSGNAVDVMEIDGASNNSVDDVRDLRERVKYAPSAGKFKVYIIDEAHMLSTSAFNALLKTLEEPPSHVLFVMATTEAKKIPLTVLSRCQHLPFRRVSSHQIKEHLKRITDSEGISASEGALSMIARAADGSIRDSLTLLDQIASFTSVISETDIKDMLDIADFHSLAAVSAAVINGEQKRIIETIANLVDHGADLRTFIKELIRFFRDLLVVKLGIHDVRVLDVSEEELTILQGIAGNVPDAHLALLLSEIVKTDNEVRSAFSARVALEMALLRLSYLSTFRTINEAIEALKGLPNTVLNVTSTTPAAVALPQVPHTAPALKSQGEIEVKADVDEVDVNVEVESEPVTQSEPSLPATDIGVTINEPETVTPEHHMPREEPAIPAMVFTSETLLQAVIDRIESGPTAAKLESASAELRDNKFILTFTDANAEMCSQPFKDDPSIIEDIASELCGAPIKTEIHIKKKKAKSPAGKRDALKKKAMEEPLVKEAMDLFDARVVDVRNLQDPKDS